MNIRDRLCVDESIRPYSEWKRALLAEDEGAVVRRPKDLQLLYNIYYDFQSKPEPRRIRDGN